MTIERVVPDAILVQTNLTGTLADIDEDPNDAVDTTKLTATGNNVSTDVRASFPTTTDPLTSGADLQTFQAKVQRFSLTQTGVPTSRIELWAAGVLVRAGTNTTVGTTDTLLTFTWNATEVANRADVECKVIGNATGGSPTVRNTVNVVAVDWNADTSPNITVTGNQATTADAGQAGTPLQSLSGSQATEAATAFAGTFRISMAGAQATEAPTGFSGAPALSPLGNQATESNTAQAGAPVLRTAGNQATETNTVNAGTPATSGGGSVTVTGNQATTTNTGLGGTLYVTLTGQRATTTDAGAAGAVYLPPTPGDSSPTVTAGGVSSAPSVTAAASSASTVSSP